MVKKIENMDHDEFVDHIKSLDDEAFMEAWTAYGEQVTEARKKLTEFSQDHQRRTRLQQLRDMGLSQSDVELLQSVEPAAVETAEVVNTPDDEDDEES